MAQDTAPAADFKTRYPDHKDVSAVKASQFLTSIAHGGPVLLVCFGATGGFSRQGLFDTSDPHAVAAMRSFIAFQETQANNVFYLANVAEGCAGVPGRDDITSIRMIVLDFDPDKSLPLDDERDRLRQRAHDFLTGPLQPRAIVDTGGGIQVVYELLEPVPATEDRIVEIERLMKSLAKSLGADTKTCSAKNLFRVPHTYNWPNEAKKLAGRVRSVSGVWFSGGPRVALADLYPFATVSSEDGPVSAPVEFGDLSESDLTDALGEPSALPAHLIEAARDPMVLKVLNRTPIPNDRSGSDFSMACGLIRLEVSPKDTAVLLSAYGHKVETTFHEERLFSYVIHTVEKAVARVRSTHLLDDYQDEAEKIQDEAERKTRHARLKLLSYEESIDGIFSAENSSLIAGLMRRGEVAVLYGKPGAGKTFVVLDLAFHIAQGKPWNDHEVKKSHVVYIATESSLGIRYRLKALGDRYGPPGECFHLVPTAVNMFDPKVDLKPLMEEISKVDGEIGLIVIDTLARAMVGGNENSAQDMSRLIDNGDRLAARFGAAIAWVHHSGKNEAAGARGSSALLAATDTEIEISDMCFRSTKMRDREHIEYRFMLKQVEVGTMDNGELVTSCVVDWKPSTAVLGHATPGDKNLHTVVEVLRGRGQSMTFKEILAEAESFGRKFTIKQESLRTALNRSCENDANLVFTRETADEFTTNKKVIYRYGLVNW